LQGFSNIRDLSNGRYGKIPPPPKLKMPATLVPDWCKMSKQITDIGQYLRFVAGGK